MSKESWLLCATIAIVLVCTSILSFKPSGSAINLSQLETIHPGEYRAFIVFRPGDCEDNISAIHAFSRDEASSYIRTTGLFLGPAHELQGAEVRLRDLGISLPLHHADQVVQDAIRTFGHKRTPVLILMNPFGELQLMISTPLDSKEPFAFIDKIIRAVIEASET